MNNKFKLVGVPLLILSTMFLFSPLVNCSYFFDSINDKLIYVDSPPLSFLNTNNFTAFNANIIAASTNFDVLTNCQPILLNM